jgi:hypothetical protein
LSIVKKAVATIIVLVIIAVFGYIVLTMAQSQGGQRGSDQGGGFLASDNVRTFVTLGVVGGSAFITGFGVRDVISRALAARKYMHMRAAREQKSL